MRRLLVVVGVLLIATIVTAYFAIGQARQARYGRLVAERSLAEAEAAKHAAETNRLELLAAQAQAVALESEQESLRLKAEAALLSGRQAEAAKLRQEAAARSGQAAAARKQFETLTEQAQKQRSETVRPPVAGDYRDIYRDAVRAMETRNWSEAARLFQASIDQHGADTGERILMYGTRIEPYFPNYNLGLSLKNIGKCSEAMRAWDQSEQDGAIKQNASLYRALQENRQQCRGDARPSRPPK